METKTSSTWTLLSAVLLATTACGDDDDRRPDDGISPDAGVDAGMPDAGMPGMPDAGIPDAAVPGMPDAAMPDAAMLDAGMPDAEMPDAAMPDAAMPDAAMLDAGMPDAGMPDAGMPDLVSAQITRGQTAYSNSCAQCHGADGSGNTAPALVGENALPRQPPAGRQIRTSEFVTALDVFEFAAEQMPLSAPGSLPTQDYLDIVAAALDANGISLDEPLTSDNADDVVINP